MDFDERQKVPPRKSRRRVPRLLTVRNVGYAVLGLPLWLAQRLLSPWVHIRIGKIRSDRLGHFVGESDNFMSGLKFGSSNDVHKSTWYFFDSKPINRVFERALREQLKIAPRIFLKGAYGLNQVLPGRERFNATWPSLTGLADFSNLTPATRWFQFSASEIDSGHAILKQLGLAPDENYVCLFPRDPEYGLRVAARGVETAQRYRNCDLMTFQLAIDFLVSRGYKVLRMGRQYSNGGQSKVRGVIDYTAQGCVGDLADLILTAHCTFAIGCDTGAVHLPLLFRKPTLITNVMTPWGLSRGSAVTLYLMKTWADREGHHLTLRELLFLDDEFGASGPGPDHFDSLGLQCLDNSPQAILGATKEMVEYVESTNEAPWQIRAASLQAAQLLTLRQSGNWNIRFAKSFLAEHPEFL